MNVSRIRGTEQPVLGRRKNPRVPLRVDVTLNSTHQFFQTENVSVGGLFVTTDAPFAVGEVVTVRFSLPDVLGTIAARCTVRWCRTARPGVPAGVGLEFIHLEGNHHRFIDHFVAQRPPLASESFQD